ncbi:MAG: YdiU family protein [Deltaproteobacteria bacterium]|nr:YdiU family protein [Deltaproteobacteria bacterium]
MPTPAPELFRFDNTYARALPGCYAPVTPATVPAPQLLQLNQALAGELGLDVARLDPEVGAAVFGGNLVPAGATPIAQAYAGHQFGGFVPQLGDGRAVLLGEVIDRHGRRRDIALKGSGRTPFSRGGDGKAAVGPVLREYVIGEAMHALGIPTTRALAAVRSGETVWRDRPLPGALLTRVAGSHVRVGTFQFFAVRGQHDTVRALADYVIARHDPDLAADPDRYLGLLSRVAARQAALIAQWMLVGFIHGVMNTDNMTISGETIDYGPCAFMEAYDPATVFSSIDAHGRYAYGNQPAIARWNLARFAETLLPLIDPDSSAQAIARATAVIEAFPDHYATSWLDGARAKLGLHGADADDETLAADWLALLAAQQVDFTLAWRRLGDAAAGDAQPLTGLFADAAALTPWLDRWRRRAERDGRSGDERRDAMQRLNPLYIARNHRVEEALDAASTHGDLTAFERLVEVVSQPFDERRGWERYAEPAPREVTARYQTFCGT